MYWFRAVRFRWAVRYCNARSEKEGKSSFNIGIRLVRGIAGSSESVTSTGVRTAQNGNGKVLIAFFSWGGNTRGIAKEIQSQTGADLFEIELVEPYSDDYNTVLDEAQRDQNAQARPQLSTHVENMEEYDTIILGYPNWWASIPMPIASFLEEYDFAGKTVIPFCSHGGGRFGQSLTAIAKLTPDAVMGEAAVSGVSLVNQFNTIFIYLFTALASGGAVVISQYIGKRENGQAGEAASQLLLFSAIFSLVIAAAVLLGNEAMLRLLFGKVEKPVMDACVTYLRISAYSYPALAVYNTGAAVYRSLGKTDTTMHISVVSNAINVAGNLVGVFVLHAGVAGVAWPSFMARVFSAVVITFFCFRKGNGVVYKVKWILKWNSSQMESILHVAVPNGIENGIFQLVKVALSSIVALFGTYQIAANGVAQSIWSLAALAGVAMGPVFITVIGQCMGDGDTEAAGYYFKKLAKATVLISSVWNLLILVLTPAFLRFYSLSPETKKLVFWLVLIHNVFNAAAFPFSGALSNGLRAAGDVKFTMYVSVASTIAVRLFLSYVLGITLQMGVIGIALAMVSDWTLRAVLFIWRERAGTWKNFRVLKI